MRKTTFILGAGASHPYSFPTGLQLMDDIIQDLSSKPQAVGQPLTIQDRKLSAKLRAARTDSLDQFVQGLSKYADSIKTEIGRKLLYYEEQNPDVDCKKRDEDWYLYIINTVFPKRESFETREAINIISFNYDRSLEHFLQTTIKERHEEAEKDAFALAYRAFNITHVYGRMPLLPFEETYLGDTRDLRIPVVPYGKALSYNMPDDDFDNHSRSHLSTCYEVAAHNEEIRNKILKTDRIIFLGFSYNEQNMELLDKHIITRRAMIRPLEIFGTTFKMKKIAIQRLKDRYSYINFLGSEIDCITALHDEIDILK